jgi:hypothetical protein
MAHVTLGDHVKDPITGFEGTLTSRTEFLHNCVRVAVTGHVLDKDGNEKILHFDIAQLELVEAGKHAPKTHNAERPPGGPARISSPVPSASTQR